ncbi:histidinol-phosphate transaminase [Dorea ammoniilytica]
MKYTHGGDIYTTEYRLDFSANICPFGANEAVRQAAIRGMEKVTAYPDSQCRRLRQKLAETLKIPVEWIIAGNGAADVLFSLVLAEKPEKGMILAPAFQEYEQSLRSAGSQVIVWERNPEQEFRLDEEFLVRLEKELKEGLGIVFFCMPDNPSGVLISKDILLQSLELCEKYYARMVVDESFWEFAFDREAETMLPYIGQFQSLFLLRSFTKMYGIPGLRLGYGLCSDTDLLERMEEVRQPWGVSIPAQEAGIAALDETDWCRQVRSYVTEQRMWLAGELESMGCKVYPSSANYLLFYLDQELMEPLKRKGILIRDCSNYQGLTKGYYRIAVKTEEENRQLIDAIRDVIDNTDLRQEDDRWQSRL